MLIEQQMHIDVVYNLNFNSIFIGLVNWSTRQLINLPKPHVVGKPNNGSAYNDQEKYSDKSIAS